MISIGQADQRSEKLLARSLLIRGSLTRLFAFLVRARTARRDRLSLAAGSNFGQIVTMLSRRSAGQLLLLVLCGASIFETHAALSFGQRQVGEYQIQIVVIPFRY